jgi:uncharacterized protein (TIGR02001 family)
MIKTPFRKIILTFTVLIGSVLSSLQSQAQEDKREIPSFNMTGELALLTNYVDRGLTQTNKDPALQGAVSFNFGPQFKMGLWGSNVNFQSSEHFLLKVNAELMVPVSPTAEVDFGYNNNKYFKTDTRDGGTMYLQVKFSQFRILYQSESNWEGTGTASTHYIFGMISDLSPSWKWDNEAGYSMLTLDTYTNYFYGRTSALYKGGNSINYQISASMTSEAAQFNGRGDLAIYLGASRKF